MLKILWSLLNCHNFCFTLDQVRLNQRIMETFPRPDIAEGIFFEYLRYDDPISPELRERVVDGFPFLLAPLAQVKGVSLGQHQQASAAKSSDSENPFVQALSEFAEFLTSNGMAMSSMAQRGMADAASHANMAARSFNEAVQNTAKEMVRRRDVLIKRAVGLPNVVMNLFSPESVEEWVAANITPEPENEEEPVVRKDSLGRAFGYPLSRWFSDTYQAPDEIGPMKIHPRMTTTRKVFLALVHFYLLLLFIVSFPGSYTTRTKLVARKPYKKQPARPCSTASVAAKVALAEYKRSNLKIRSAGAAERLPCEKASFRNHRLFARTRQALRQTQAAEKVAVRPNSSEDSEEEAATPTSTPLKKKSLSYFV